MLRYFFEKREDSFIHLFQELINPNEPGFVFEFKKIDEPEEKNADDAMRNALAQIQNKQYATQLRAHHVKTILGIGVVVEGKQVWVESIVLNN